MKMKRNLLLISMVFLFFVSCTRDKTEVGFKYHETILNHQTDVLEAFEEALDAVTKDVEVLQLKRENALNVTQKAINETEKIEIIENGETLKKESLHLLQEIENILSDKFQKIIEIREDLNIIYRDELVDELNDIIMISHDQIDSLIIKFNKAQIDFGNHYHFELTEENQN